jgi:hypothetical protein
MKIISHYLNPYCVKYWIKQFQCENYVKLKARYPQSPELEFIGDNADQWFTIFVLTWDVTTLEYFKEYHFNIYNDYTIE